MESKYNHSEKTTREIMFEQEFEIPYLIMISAKNWSGTRHYIGHMNVENRRISLHCDNMTTLEIGKILGKLMELAPKYQATEIKSQFKI